MLVDVKHAQYLNIRQGRESDITKIHYKCITKTLPAASRWCRLLLIRNDRVKRREIVCTSSLFCTSLRLCLLGLMPQALQTGPWEPNLPPGRCCSSQNYWWGHGRETDDKCTLFWCCTSLRFCQVGLILQAWQTVPWQPLYLMAEGRVPSCLTYQPDRAQAPWRGGGTCELCWRPGRCYVDCRSL